MNTGVTNEQTDPHLPRLTIAQADTLRAMAVAHFARQGVTATAEGGRLRLADNHAMPLDNLSRFCRSTHESQWAELIEGHFSRLPNPPQPLGADDHADVLRDAKLRLIPDDYVPAEAADGFRYLRPVAAGLVEAVALDLPESVRLLDDKDVHGVGLDRLRAAARANLVAEPVEYDSLTRPDGTVIHTVGGDSVFVASKALVLAELMRDALGQEPPAEGVLLTLPSRDLLAYHPIVDRRVVTAINDLASFALGAYQDKPGPVSPRLYWWQAGALTSITHIDHDSKEFSVQPPDELMAILRALPE